KTFEDPYEELAYWAAQQREKAEQAEKELYTDKLAKKDEELVMKDEEIKEFKEKFNMQNEEFKSRIEKIAINLKNQKISSDVISKTTGLTIDEIKNLK
ncbi:MAG: hypothetical protein LBM96_03945, partial [Methanobrevibacter sp.]|nr:hypothetical protein [Candidatus Methanoflexus mossambicus]